jgi:hypothetical protein
MTAFFRLRQVAWVTGAFTYFLATAAGQFGNPICNPIPAAVGGGGVISAAAVDYDADGDQDLFLIRDQAPYILGFDQVSPGIFAASIVIPLPYAPRGMDAVDIDQDGDIDFIVNYYPGYSIVREVGGAAQITTNHTDFYWSLFDFDGDGDLDMRRANGVALNDGTGVFSQTVALSYSSEFAAFTFLGAAGDVDGDGDCDFYASGGVAATQVGFDIHYVTVIEIHLNDGGGALRHAHRVVDLDPGVMLSLAFGDFDGDGDRDLVVEDDYRTNTLRFFWNDGGGRFARGGKLTTATAEIGMADGLQVADLNGDGADDVLQRMRRFAFLGYPIVLGGPCAPLLIGSVSPPYGVLTIEMLDVMGSPQPDIVFIADGPFSGDTSLCVRENFMQPFAPAAVTMTVVSGERQAARFGEPYAQPLGVLVQTPSGQPVAGQTVAFHAPAGVLSAASAITNAQGLAQVTASAGSTGGDSLVVASIAGVGCAKFHLTELGLRARFYRHHVYQPTADDALVVQLFHDRAGMPLIIAADVPLASPEYVSTSYGDLFTSILNPAPSLLVLDGIGAFGPADATVRTQPDWSRLIRLPQSVALSGAVIVLQAYGYDSTLPFPESVFVSNTDILIF